jgi:hypothetical protein
VLLVGCGEDDPFAGYCEVVTDNQAELSEILAAGGPDALLAALPIFRELQDAAPDDIQDDWEVVVGGLTSLERALEDAGVDPATYDREKPPEGVTQAETDRIDAAAQELASPTSVAAFGAVEQQARDVCQAPLRL